MLLPIEPGTAHSLVFQRLNGLLGDFLDRCVIETSFRRTFLAGDLWGAVWGNLPTRRKLRALFNVLNAQTQLQRQEVRDAFFNCQNLDIYFSDVGADIPVLPQHVLEAIKAVTVHFFSCTSRLVPVERACNESVREHFSCFRDLDRNGTGNVCAICATDVLAQYRADVDADGQWLGPYDHILAKALYPMYA